MICATAVVGLALSTTPTRRHDKGRKEVELVYHLLTRVTFSWTHDFLATLRQHPRSPGFEIDCPGRWLGRLEGSSEDGKWNFEGKSEFEVVELLEGENMLPMLMTVRGRKGTWIFETKRTARDVPVLRAVGNLVGRGLVGWCVDVWTGLWRSQGPPAPGGPVLSGDL